MNIATGEREKFLRQVALRFYKYAPDIDMACIGEYLALIKKVAEGHRKTQWLRSTWSPEGMNHGH